ncbi:hypothetical protein PIB30_084619 [Stylosanthes scabra]|uniref:Uncharacterized protein n=1 Tax=Stylosanthes scabra TaxID=79078 RepID=A0ABU6UV73_9FABA|nr:hypothetical protein [Stylosanthes scabra]
MYSLLIPKPNQPLTLVAILLATTLFPRRRSPSLTTTHHKSPSPPLISTHRHCLPHHQLIGHDNRSERKTLAWLPSLQTRICSNPSLQVASSHHRVAFAPRPSQLVIFNLVVFKLQRTREEEDFMAPKP